jgi:hypothetical protein
MRHSIGLGLVLALPLMLSGCGGEADDTPEAAPPEAAGPISTVVETTSGGLGDMNTAVHVAPEIAEAWRGVRVRVVDIDTGEGRTFEIPLGGADILGDTGLTLSAGIFIPDFVMDERGITSRSSEPQNPAVRVIISEDGMEDYEGWLFADMPEIESYPNPFYRVLLVEGIPAESP